VNVTIATNDTTYTAGLGWSGWIHKAVMTNLQPSTTYNYWVSASPSAGVSNTRGPFRFTTSAGAAVVGSYVAVFGDQGTVIPFGFLISDFLAWDHNPNSAPKIVNNVTIHPTGPFSNSLLAGDVAYAWLGNHNMTELEFVWDMYGRQTEAHASSLPLMTTVGNHESPNEFSSFLHRYTMPAGADSNANFWFSYDHEGVHYTSMSSEHPYAVGTPQWNWIRQDLAAAAAPARRARVPWLVLSLHRPLYCSEGAQYPAHRPGSNITVAIEPLLLEFKVDLVIDGHVHAYERVHPVNNGTVVTWPQGADNVYTDPAAPLHITQGTGGAFQEANWVQPQPVWSANRLVNVYGYGRMRVWNATALDYEFIVDGLPRDSFKIRKTAAPGSA
jgi:hypothetical protein